MDQNHALSQEDIDALFKSQGGHAGSRSKHARYDFRRTDRIPKEQIRALRAVHDTFARSLASSLSAYLRTYVTVNLISVEQLSFADFKSTLPSPTCLATVQMKPFEGVAILEVNPTLAFPMIEVMLGGGKLRPIVVEREMTIIEQQVLDSLLQLILQNLGIAWQGVARVAFNVESHETEPALLNVLPPNEAVVVIATEVALAETSGMLNIGLPSNIVKLLRQKFDQQWVARRASAGTDDGQAVLDLISDVPVRVEARMRPTAVTMEQLLELEPGDVLQFDRAITEPLEVILNGERKFSAGLVKAGRKRGLSIQEPA